MQFSKLSFLIVSLCFFILLDSGFAGDPPVIINRSTEVHVIGGKKYHFHAVLQGQTLFSIARAYGVTVDDIKAENPELEHGLRYDQLIKIPYVETPVEEKRNDYIEHKVRRRETLFGLSQQYDISMEKILEHNPEARKGLQVNQVLRIPVKPSADQVAEHKTHTVLPGETFFSLSRKFDVSVDEIIELNPELNGVLKAGSSIKLPDHAQLEPTDVTYDKSPEYKKDEYAEQWHEIELWDRDYCRNPDLKDHYNVALLIPLFLEEVQEYYESGTRLPDGHKSLTFLEFYEGLLIALDSVRQFGANITLHVYDVCQDISKARTILAKPEFKEMDFIIGSFFPETLEIVAQYADKHGISIVSPLLQDRKQLKFHSNLFQFTPSLTTQLNELAEYIAYKYPTQNIILIHNNQPGVANIINDFNLKLNEHIGEKRYYSDSINLARINGYYYDESLIGERATSAYVFNDSLFNYFEPPSVRQSIYNRDEVLKLYLQRQNVEEIVLARDSISGLKSKMLGNQGNVLVSLFGGEPIVSNYLRELTLLADTFEIVVFGVPQWKNYRSLEIDNMQTINVHIITPEFINYSNRHIQDFVIAYRNRYNSEPGHYAFKGVETGFYFINTLMTYGRDFPKCIYQVNRQGEYNAIRFKKTDGEHSGWENVRSTIFIYDNYRMIDVRKPSLVDR